MPLFIDVRPWAVHRGMTLGINESRFATSRVWDLWERVRCLINDFLKIVDKTPDDRWWARGKPGVDCNAGVAICTGRLPAFTKHFDVRGRRLALATTALRSPPMHRRTALKASLLAFCKNDESLAAVRSYR